MYVSNRPHHFSTHSSLPHPSRIPCTHAPGPEYHAQQHPTATKSHQSTHAQLGRKMNHTNLTLRDLYDTYNLNRRYNHPDNVTFSHSYFGDGKYPPDWGEKRTDISTTHGGRREAIREYQGGLCARCGTDISNSDFNCHHYLSLDQGGKHDLNNLLTLCLPCHRLIHPDVDDLDGNWREAPIFPSIDADPRMATVRKPVVTSERRQYLPSLSLIAEKSTPAENTPALSTATFEIGPGDALAAAEDFERLLDEMGIHFDSEYTVHVTSSADLSLYDATVELTVSSQYGTNITLETTTDRSGNARFELPAGREIKATVTKGRLGPVEFVDTTTTEPRTREITLQD
jgi:hypothetical protein